MLGSWTFIVVTAIFIAGWMVVNAEMARSFEAHPYILLNLVLACLTVLHASFVRMSQIARRPAIGRRRNTTTRSMRRPNSRLPHFAAGWTRLAYDLGGAGQIQQQQLELLTGSPRAGRDADTPR